MELKEVASGFRYQVRQDVNPWVARLWSERQTRYSRALLETLSLIAYRQPITRGEIEQIRGVAVSSNIVKTLEEREWIRVVGYRDVPGKPELFGTTRSFLDYFNLKSLDELPPLAEIRDLSDFDPQLGLAPRADRRDTGRWRSAMRSKLIRLTPAKQRSATPKYRCVKRAIKRCPAGSSTHLPMGNDPKHARALETIESDVILPNTCRQRRRTCGNPLPGPQPKPAPPLPPRSKSHERAHVAHPTQPQTSAARRRRPMARLVSRIACLKCCANAGLGSRRMLEQRIEAGEVRVNANVAELGSSVRSRRCRVELDNKLFVVISDTTEHTQVLIYNKPGRRGRHA